MTNPPLTTSRLHLVPLQPEHADALFAPLQDERLYAFIADGPPASMAVLRERYTRLAGRCSPAGQDAWLNWVMQRRSDARPVGLMQATVTPAGAAYLAYIVFPPFWRQGYAREGSQAVIAHLLDDVAVGQLILEMDRRNTASVRVAEALGFRRLSDEQAAAGEYRYVRLP